jgi:hypothetical protein
MDIPQRMELLERPKNTLAEFENFLIRFLCFKPCFQAAGILPTKAKHNIGLHILLILSILVQNFIVVWLKIQTLLMWESL